MNKAIMAKVADSDRAALVDFMQDHAPSMMFPLTNLNRYGLGGAHPRSINAWVRKENGSITDVLAISQEGMVFPCCPTAPWHAAAAVTRDIAIKGFIGDGHQVANLRHAMGITQKAELDATEPAFLLRIADMVLPQTQGYSLHPLSAAPYELIVEWRAAYETETLAVPVAAARARAEKQIQTFITTDSHRVLFKDGAPVAMTGFNASLPEIVQIGGVYTPPAHRSQGFARTALALHLQEVSVDGVTEAVLSAANEAAARAYIAIGFQQTGSFALVVYDKLQVSHG